MTLLFKIFLNALDYKEKSAQRNKEECSMTLT